LSPCAWQSGNRGPFARADETSKPDVWSKTFCAIADGPNHGWASTAVSLSQSAGESLADVSLVVFSVADLRAEGLKSRPTGVRISGRRRFPRDSKSLFEASQPCRLSIWVQLDSSGRTDPPGVDRMHPAGMARRETARLCPCLCFAMHFRGAKPKIRRRVIPYFFLAGLFCSLLDAG
jgi:hypothetical protein